MERVSGDHLKAPGFPKGPAGPLAVPRASELAAAFSGFLPAGLCPAIAPTEISAMQNQREALVPIAPAPEPGL